MNEHQHFPKWCALCVEHGRRMEIEAATGQPWEGDAAPAVLHSTDENAEIVKNAAPTDRLAALRELILADLRDAYGYDNSANVADGIMSILRDADVTLALAEGLREAIEAAISALNGPGVRDSAEHAHAILRAARAQPAAPAEGLRWGEDVYETECPCGQLGNEPHATDCPQPAAPAEGLREAAQTVVILTDDLARWDELNHYAVNSDRDYLAGNLSAAWDRLRAALAAPAK